MGTYGNLDFTLADGEVHLVVDVHAFECILAVIAALHQKHNRESACRGDKKVGKLIFLNESQNWSTDEIEFCSKHLPSAKISSTTTECLFIVNTFPV